jgi:hypothetical protein
MPIAKVRDLGKYGIITDRDAYDLPTQAFSAGVNIRFSDGRVQRSPVFRTASNTLSADPRQIVVIIDATNTDKVYISYRNGRVKRWDSSTGELDVSIIGYADFSVDEVFTTTQLANVLYFNREDRVPWALTPAALQFSPLGGGWDSTWRAKTLRSYNNSLVALNVTKGGVNGPKLVKTSDFVVADGSIPLDWDHTSTTNNATENILTELQAPLLDGVRLRDNMILYTRKETWVMSADGSNLVYRYLPLFTDAGVINQNCVVEVDNVHYCFGQDDLWMHDGNTKRSIADGRVRRRFFGTLRADHTKECFVSYNPILKQVSFNCVSSNPLATFGPAVAPGANFAAVYDIGTDTWSFEDRPYVWGSCLTTGGVSGAQTWDSSAGIEWNTAGGTWADLEDASKRGVFYVGSASPTHSLVPLLYGYDLFGEGSSFALPVHDEATKPALLFREGIDLDELDVDLIGYKQLRSITPQGRVNAANPIEFAFGSNNGFSEQPIYSEFQTWDGVELHKVDFRDAGRFLGMKLRHTGYEMSLSGLDVDMIVTGHR